MPAARGKVEIRVAVPPELKDQLEAEAAARGLDRSTWICMRLQTLEEEDDGGHLTRVLEQVIRGQSEIHDQLTQVVTLIETFVAAVGKPQTREKQYPAPATWRETYPELYASEGPAERVDPTPPKKGWGRWRR